MKQLVVFTPGLSHTQLGLISTYLDKADIAFSFRPENTQAASLVCGKEKIKVLSKNKINFYQELKNENYDAVYVHGVNSSYMFPLLLGAKLAKIPRIIACGHLGADQAISTLPTWSYHKASTSDIELGRKMFRGKAKLILNGVDSRYCLDESLRQAWRLALGVTSQDVFLQVSPFNTSSHYDQTLDTFHKILSLNKNARLICVGQGPLRGEILARIEYENLSDFVSLPGDTSNIVPFLMAADAILIPDENPQVCDLLPLAQVAGLPCFVADKSYWRTKLTEEGIYPIQDLLEFKLAWEQRQKTSELALMQAHHTNRTSELIGQALVEIASL